MQTRVLEKDKVAKTIDVYETKDYDKFSIVKGNRDVDIGHVRSLQRSMLDHGNRLAEEPIEVGKNYEIFDGQHRFEAAKNLGFPIYYIFKERTTISDIRIANSNRKNWNWYDYATSYRDDLRNENYKQFLMLIEDYGEPFGVTLKYTGTEDFKKTALRRFLDGAFIMKDYEKTQRLLGMYQELSDVAKVHNREFAFACYRYMQTSTYNHSRMLTKLRAHRTALNNCYFENEYLLTMQDIWRA